MQSLSLYMHLCIFHFYFRSFVQVQISFSCVWYIFSSSTFTFFDSFAQYDYSTFFTLLYCLFIMLSLFFSHPLSLSFLSKYGPHLPLSVFTFFCTLASSSFIFLLFCTLASSTFTSSFVGYIHTLQSAFIVCLMGGGVKLCPLGRFLLVIFNYIFIKKTV